MSGYSAKVIKLQKENKQLRKALETKHYCKYANRCNELYDCTREEYNSMAECNMKLSLENDELQQENKHLNLQLDQALKDYDELLTKIDKAIEEINYMITNADITEISAIKLKQILGDKE